MSQIEVDKIIPQSGTSTQLGESGDTITIPAGATITNNGTANGFGSADTEKVKVSANDTTAGFLNGKLVAGTNISLTEGSDGGNETLTAALSGTIATAQIADDAVTLAKMAPGTDGNIISYDASGNPVAVATGSAGQVLTSAGAGAPPTFATIAGGKVLQVVNATTSTEVSNTATSYIDTGLIASITPSSTSNKVLIIIQQVMGKNSANTWIDINLLRDSTTLASMKSIGYTASTQANYIGIGSGFNYLDTPSSTSSLTFKTEFRNVTASGTVKAQQDSSTSMITLMEIAG